MRHRIQTSHSLDTQRVRDDPDYPNSHHPNTSESLDHSQSPISHQVLSCADRLTVVNHYSRRTRLFRKLQRLRLPSALVFHADVCKLAEVARAFAVFVGHRADEHAESRFEGCHWGGLGGAEECVGHVVYHLERVRMGLAGDDGWKSWVTMPPFVFSMPC
jgi:hypothetical protein